MIGRTNTGGGGGIGCTLTVTALSGVTVTVSKDGKKKTKIANADGVAVFKGLATGTWNITITDGEKTATKDTVITADYAVNVTFNKIPDFTYTGNYAIVNDSDKAITVSQDNWKIRFLTSGTLKFTSLNGASDGIDVFCVGGGGGGGQNAIGGDTGNRDCGGGGGGYTKTGSAIPKVGTNYEIVIGAGGAVNSSGGQTSAFSILANGGKNGSSERAGAGGAGGSGGGGGNTSAAGGAGGSNGSDGYTGSGGGAGGKGQGTTTREFGESTGALYAGGGGGGRAGSAGGGKGGAGGGGDGSNVNGNEGAAKNGTTNTGGGGGGKGHWNYGGGSGGSGIVVIRNKRG